MAYRPESNFNSGQQESEYNPNYNQQQANYYPYPRPRPDNCRWVRECRWERRCYPRDGYYNNNQDGYNY
ncbi:hypothetical protein [Bacillus thuringiensis]|uniref:Uncharacterized protein n=1 Tax=Bacillus thuringiensis subsp. higo TaxID=132266 RepID=A0A9X6M2C3_BACUH|nr:hypothetical protein [Bacillus thuringiensis]OUB62841.1 hypothetical protein BK716_00090 [Bacillus thuringiensis serovar higo]